MRYCRFASPDGPKYGLIETIAGADQITRTCPEAAAPNLSWEQKISPIALNSVSLLVPSQPSKIVCVGRNYADHAKEFGNEVPPDLIIFLKPPTSLLAPGGKIVRPQRLSQRVDFEGELAAVIAKSCLILTDADDVRWDILQSNCSDDRQVRDPQRQP